MKLLLLTNGELLVTFEKREWKMQLAFLDSVSSPDDKEEAEIVKMTNSIVDEHQLKLAL